MSLTKFCFVHRDYMNLYMERLPKPILDTVAENVNCEDIAMSLLISSMTQGQPPLLADAWAMSTHMPLRVNREISGGKNHKKLRGQCVDTFAQLLSLKNKAGSNRLQKAKLIPSTHPYFESGAIVDDQLIENYTKSQREIEHYDMINKWKTMGQDELMEEFGNIVRDAGRYAQERGLLRENIRRNIWNITISIQGELQGLK
jgi:Glycosyl transferase family 64 domain